MQLLLHGKALIKEGSNLLEDHVVWKSIINTGDGIMLELCKGHLALKDSLRSSLQIHLSRYNHQFR